jgi:hypothetical protein
MSYLEFTVRASGQNIYAGTLYGTAEESIIPFAQFTNGGWSTATNNFTPVAANPQSLGVVSGMYVSLMTDGTSTSTPSVAMIDAVSSIAFHVDPNKKFGTFPTTSAAGITAIIGGAWSGPSGTMKFPFDTINKSTISGPSGEIPRINFKNNRIYDFSSTTTYNTTGSQIFEGYANTFGDNGQAIITQSTPGASIILLTFSAGLSRLKSFIFKDNGTSGSSDGLSVSNCIVENVVSTGHRGNGILAANAVLYNCGAFNNNISKTSNKGGFSSNATLAVFMNRCVASGNYIGGFTEIGNTLISKIMINCISFNNYGAGLSSFSAGPNITIQNCDFYNNAFDGITFRPSSYGVLNIQNCNILKNTGYGINIRHRVSVTNACNISIINTRFGDGTYANGSGTVLGLIDCDINNSSYPSNVSPWVDVNNFDFRLKLPESSLSTSYLFASGISSNNISYRSIGAVESPNITFRNIMSGGGL